MVTILPLDVDDDLMREGLQYAVASRLRTQLNEAEKLVNELSGGGIIGRKAWEARFAAIAEQFDATLPILEYARAFDDQWPEFAADDD